MSRRSLSQYHHGAHHGHSAGDRAQDAATNRAAGGYTLLHAGRALRLGPIAFWSVVGTLVIMGVWTIVTATYFAFRDDVLTRLIARQAEMQFGYEDRIADLRAQVDRITSRQLLDQEQYEHKLEQILARQAALEARASALGGLSEITGSVRPVVRGGGQPRSTPLKPSPIGDKGALLFAPGRERALDPGTAFSFRAAGGVAAALTRLQVSLDRVEQRQMAALSSMEEGYDWKARRVSGVLRELGVDLGKISGIESARGMGGPFIPARLPKDAGVFEHHVHRISAARSQINRLARALVTIPLRKPIDTELDLVSPFGVRSDPFSGTPAMHTGLDLHGAVGEPARATAEGTVTSAGWSGGYGRVVDIDHGNGLSTRYAHLSSIEVHVGQAVRVGQIVGRIGSSGRSTAPHLHYETRIKGEPVDPQKFLRAGQRLDL
jgi:murein DD-endopeptidase MepM/ murein hydrolase activator NlpD